MLLRLVFMFTCLIIGNKASAQIYAISDTTVCLSYTIPAAQGDGLSSDIVYSSEPQGSGIIYNVGDVLTESSQIFVYDSKEFYEECYFANVISTPPNVYANPNIQSCDGYAILPYIQGKYLTSLAAYYTEPGGQGTAYFPGRILTESDTLYIYDGIASCFSEDTIVVEILPEIFLPEQNDLRGCTSVVLPQIYGSQLPKNTYYEDVNTGEKFFGGDILTDSRTLEAVADTSFCTARQRLSVKVAPAYLPDLPDTVVCGSYRLPNAYRSLGEHTLFIEDKNGKRLLPKNPIYTSSTKICLIDSIIGKDCSNRSCFDLQIHKTHRFVVPKDTLRMCKVSDVPLKQILGHLLLTFGFSITDHGDIPIRDFYTADFSALKDSTYWVTLVTNPSEDCPYYIPETLEYPIIVSSDCIARDTVDIKEGIQDFYVCKDRINLINTIIHFGYGLGGKLYNEDYSTELPLPYFVNNLTSDTLVYHYVESSNNIHDTLDLIFPFIYKDFVPQIKGNLDLCYGECFEFFYTTGNTRRDSIWISKSHLIELQPDFSITKLKSFFKLGKVCFDDKPSENSTVYLTKPNASFHLSLENTFINCFEDTKIDNIQITTLDKPYRKITDHICRNESITIGGESFDFARPNGRIIVPASSGCDSIIDVSLTFKERTESYINNTFCDTTKYIIANCKRYDFKNPSDTVVYAGAGKTGCDSLIIIDLSYVFPQQKDSTLVLCDTDSIISNGVSYFDGDFYKDTLYSFIGCDSLYVDITVRREVERVFIDTLICGDQVFIYQDKEFDTGTHVFRTKNRKGCDSIITQIKVDRLDTNFLDIKDTTLCVHESLVINLPDDLSSVELNGQPMQETITIDDIGSYILTVTKSNACMVTDTFDVRRIVPTENDEVHDICPGDSILLYGQYYHGAGSYTDTLRSASQCDSIYRTLEIREYDFEYEVPEGYTICPDEQLDLALPYDIISASLNGNAIDINTPYDKEGRYALQIRDSNTCSRTIDFSLSFDTSKFYFSQDLTDTLLLDELQMPIVYIGEFSMYEWSPSNGLSCTDCAFPNILSTESQLYTIEATSMAGCKYRQSIDVSFQNSFIGLPNIIAREASVPKNRVYKLFTNQSITYEMYIYDRWGNKVYSNNDLRSDNPNAGWIPDKNLVPGVYTSLIILDSGQRIKESVTLQ